MKDVSDWLIRTGKPQYSPLFTQKGVDGTNLLKLHREDLITMGVGVSRLYNLTNFALTARTHRSSMQTC